MGIQFWHGLQQGPILNEFRGIVDKWNQSQTEYRVELKDFKDYGAPANEALSVAPNEQPSLVLAPEFMTGKMMTACGEKKVIPIKKLIDEKHLQKIANLVKFTFGDKEGNLFSLPFNPACGVIFTNKELMKLTGKGENYVPKSMEELEEVCKWLLSNNLVDAGYTCAWPAAYLVEVPATQQNYPLVVPENGRLVYGEYQLSQEWLKKHFLDLRKQAKEHVFVYAGKDNNSRIPFIQRKVAFYMQGSTHYSTIQNEDNQSAKPFEVGCGPLPTLTRGQKEKDKYAFPLGGAAIWVIDNPNTTKMAEGVRSFLNYLLSEDVQERWHKQTAYVPALSDLPKKLEDYYRDHPLHKAVVAQTLEAAIGNYSFGVQAPNYAEARKEMFDLIEKILNLDTPDEQVSILLKEFDAKFSLQQK